MRRLPSPCRRSAARALLGLVTALGWVTPEVRATDSEVAIGVVSPLHGRSESTGRAHEDTIRLAFQHLGEYLLVDNQAIHLRPVYRDDGGEKEESVRVARDLVSNDRVVAILGPVNSGCTEEVMKQDLEVPVISSLSTAPSLTAETKRWFFRATIDDRERMRRYADAISTQQLAQGETLLLYEDDPYGQGLASSLREFLHLNDAQLKRWQDIANGSNAEITQGRGFSPEFLASLPAGSLSIFLLGTEQGAVAIARGLDLSLPPGRPAGALHFFFVGGGDLLLTEAPEGSITIGEPVADTDELRGDPRFLLTAYEATYYVLRGALRDALSSGVDPSNVQALRERVRDALEKKGSDSTTPWRKIRFDDHHNLEQPPPTPVYRIALERSYRNITRVPPPPWVQLSVPQQARFLEEPVRIVLEGHEIKDGEDIELVVLDERDQIRDSTTVRLAGGKASYNFYPDYRGPGTFRVKTNHLQHPAEPAVVVRSSMDYVWAGVAALIGALLAAAGSAGSLSARRVLVGVVTGVVLCAISSWARAVPGLGSVPIPSFGTDPLVNAWASGFVGGWGGPSVIGLFGRQPPPAEGTGKPAPPKTAGDAAPVGA